MGYVIIEIEAAQQSGGFAYVEFNEKEFELTKEVTLNGKPLSVQKDGGKLILIYKGNNKKREPFKVAVG